MNLYITYHHFQLFCMLIFFQNRTVRKSRFSKKQSKMIWFFIIPEISLKSLSEQISVHPDQHGVALCVPGTNPADAPAAASSSQFVTQRH